MQDGPLLTLPPLDKETITRINRLEKAGWLVFRDQTGKLICFPEGTQIFNLEDAHNKRLQDMVNPNFPPERERIYLRNRGWKVPEKACADLDAEVCRHPKFGEKTFTLSEAAAQQLEMDKNHINP